MTTKRLELEFASEPVNFHCPVCGTRLFNNGCPDASCPHLLFRAESAARIWEWCDAASRALFEAEIDKLYGEKCSVGYCGTREDFVAGLSIERIADCAAKTVARKSVFHVSIATSDIGCGGMHNGTMYVLLDYQPEQLRRRIVKASFRSI